MYRIRTRVMGRAGVDPFKELERTAFEGAPPGLRQRFTIQSGERRWSHYKVSAVRRLQKPNDPDLDFEVIGTISPDAAPLEPPAAWLREQGWRMVPWEE